MAMLHPNDGKKTTDRLYAWVCPDPAGIEGIITVPTRAGLLPLVSTDREQAQRMRKDAQYAAGSRGYTANLVVFERSEIIDRAEPLKPPSPSERS